MRLLHDITVFFAGVGVGAVLREIRDRCRLLQ